jgi:hypothetical protein
LPEDAAIGMVRGVHALEVHDAGKRIAPRSVEYERVSEGRTERPREEKGAEEEGAEANPSAHLVASRR